MPDILSKKALVNEKSRFEKKKGKDPKIATLSQDKAVNKKACCVLINFKWSMFDRKNKIITNSAIANQMLQGYPPRKGWEEFYKLA